MSGQRQLPRALAERVCARGACWEPLGGGPSTSSFGGPGIINVVHPMR